MDDLENIQDCYVYIRCLYEKGVFSCERFIKITSSELNRNYECSVDVGNLRPMGDTHGLVRATLLEKLENGKVKIFLSEQYNTDKPIIFIVPKEAIVPEQVVQNEY